MNYSTLSIFPLNTVSFSSKTGKCLSWRLFFFFSFPLRWIKRTSSRKSVLRTFADLTCEKICSTSYSEKPEPTTCAVSIVIPIFFLKNFLIFDK